MTFAISCMTFLFRDFACHYIFRMHKTPIQPFPYIRECASVTLTAREHGLKCVFYNALSD